MRILTGLAAAAVASLLASVPAQASIIYQTDFESPAYSVGALGGQNGWSTFGAAAASSIVGVSPIDGSQAIRVSGAQAGGQTGPFRSDPSGISKVTVSADLFLTSGDNLRAWQFSAIGPGLVGFMGGIDIDPNGNIRAITSGFQSIGTFSRGVAHRVDILLDYSSQTFGVRLDGSTLTSGLAFCGDNGPCAGAPTGGYNSLIFDTFGANGDDAGYLDNLVIQSTPGVPEPSTWVLSILGLGAAGAMLRRRRAAAFA